MKFGVKFFLASIVEVLLLGLAFWNFFEKERFLIEEEIYYRLHTAVQSFLFINQKENQFNQLNIEFLDKLCSDLGVENLYAIHVGEELSFHFFNSSIRRSLEKSSEEVKKNYLNLEQNQNYIKNQLFKRILSGKEYYSHLILANLEGKQYFFGVDLKADEYNSKIQTLAKIYFLLFVCSLVISVFFTYQFFKSGFGKRSKGWWILEFTFLLLLSVISSYFLFQHWKAKTYEKYDSKLYIAAKSLNYVLPLDYHDKLAEKGEETFYKLKPVLSNFAEFLEIYYAYTIVHKNGKFLYSATNETETDFQNSTVSEFLDEIDPSSLHLVEESYLQNKTIIYNQYGTTWGDFRSIFIPQKNIQKEDYILAIDIQIQKINQEIRVQLLVVFMQALVLFVLYFVIIEGLLFPIYRYFLNLYANRKRGLSVKYKLAIMMGFLFILSMGILSGIFSYNSKKILKDKTLKEVALLSENISNIVKEDLLMDSTYESTNSFIMSLTRAEDFGLLDLYVINLYGKYVVDTSKSRLGEHAGSSDILYIQSISKLDAKEEYSLKFKKEILKVTFPIFIEYEKQNLKIGAAVFEYDKEFIYKPLYRMQRIIFISGIVLLAVALVTTILLSRYLMNPIVELTRGVQIISSGNLSHKIEVKTKDEIGILSEKFNEMTSNLKKSYDELEDKVRERTADLQKSQQTLLTVLSNSPLALFSIDFNGTIHLAEGKNLESLGFSNEALIGISIFDVFAYNENVVQSIRETLKEKKQTVIQISIDKLFFEVNSSPLLNTEEELIGAVVLLFDITENIKAQEMIQKEKEKSERLLLNILPEPVADELKENGFVKPTLYEAVTVLFTDFKGFTKIASKLSPSELLERLNLIFLQFDQICERRGVEKLKTIGDAYMCVGGLPKKNNSHAIDTCLAGIEMQNFMRETKLIMESISGEEFWDMRLGIHTGTVIAGVIGKTKFAYDVWGDAVNTASRMESNGDIGKINISSSTYEMAKDFFICEYRGKIEAKNKGFIDMYFLLRIKPELSKDEQGIVPNQKFFDLYRERFNQENNSKLELFDYPSKENGSFSISLN